MQVCAEGSRRRCHVGQVFRDVVVRQGSRPSERLEAESDDHGGDDCACASQRGEDESREGNAESSETIRTSVVSRVNVEILVQWEVGLGVQGRVGRRVKVAEGLLQSSSEPLLRPSLAHRRLCRLTKSCRQRERPVQPCRSSHPSTKQSNLVRSPTVRVEELDVVRVLETSPFLLCEDGAERRSTKRDELVCAQELHLDRDQVSRVEKRQHDDYSRTGAERPTSKRCSCVNVTPWI